MVHSARPLTTSRSSLTSRGWKRARAAARGSGERKDHVLQSARNLSALRTQFIERPDPAQAAVREQHEAVAHPFGVDELVDGENEGPPAARHVVQHAHDLARLPEVEA